MNQAAKPVPPAKSQGILLAPARGAAALSRTCTACFACSSRELGPWLRTESSTWLSTRFRVSLSGLGALCTARAPLRKALVHCTLALLACVGCRSLERFDTRNGEAYCGSLVGQGVISLGFEELAWAGTNDEPTLALTAVRTSELSKDGGVPAIVTSRDAAFGPCSSQQKPLFDHAPLATVGKALGDRLSGMRIGEDHEEDVVTFIDSTCSGSMVAILSLVQNGDLELRFLRPAKAASNTNTDADGAPADPEQAQRFGLFVLNKTKEGCGF